MAQYLPQGISYWEKQFNRKIVKVEILQQNTDIYILYLVFEIA